MISVNEARKIANQYLLTLEPDIGESLQIVDSETIEKSFGWVFFYNSKEYLKTGDFRYMLTGNSPFIVNRNSGEVHITGTAKPIEDYIVDYEKQLQEC